MIVDKIWKLTNAVRVGLAPRSSHSQRQATFPDHVCSYFRPVTVCHTVNILLLFVSLHFFQPQQTGATRAMGKRAGNTNTGEGDKDKKVRTTSDDAGGKSVSEKSKSTGEKCVSENSTGGKPGATPTSRNPFEASRSENLQS